MRCLNCRTEHPVDADICPCCSVLVRSLLRDVLPLGTLLDHGSYRIDDILGRGGFGITYQAFDMHLERTIAIKEYYPQEFAARESASGRIITSSRDAERYRRGLMQFRAEGKVLALIKHPNIVYVYRLFEEHDTVYLVMELVDGVTLREVLDRAPDHRLPHEQVLQLFHQCVHALHTLHIAEIYHLDIKPENILVTADQQVVLIDFGAARYKLREMLLSTYTDAYAPIEVVLNEEVGPESDVYELGVVLYEMLTGKRPPPALSRRAGMDWVPDGLEEPWARVAQHTLGVQRHERTAYVLELLTFWNPAPPATGVELAPIPWYLDSHSLSRARPAIADAAASDNAAHFWYLEESAQPETTPDGRSTPIWYEVLPPADDSNRSG